MQQPQLMIPQKIKDIKKAQIERGLTDEELKKLEEYRKVHANHLEQANLLSQDR